MAEDENLATNIEPTMDTKEMALRYAGVCANCNIAMPKGSRAAYNKSLKKVYHVTCFQQGNMDAVSADKGDKVHENLVEDALPQDISTRTGLVTEKPWIDLADNRPGEGIRREALREKAETRGFAHVLNRVFDAHTEERAWRTGADGEAAVGSQLDKLVQRDPRWRVLHSVPVGQGNSDIDHVVIGPGGIFTVNTKHHRGKRIKVYPTCIYIDGYKETTYIRNSRYEAQRASKLLSVFCNFPVPVQGLIVTVNAAEFVVKQQPTEVYVLPRIQLKVWLQGLEELHTQLELDEVYAAARRSTTWHKNP